MYRYTQTQKKKIKVEGKYNTYTSNVMKGNGYSFVDSKKT